MTSHHLRESQISHEQVKLLHFLSELCPLPLTNYIARPLATRESTVLTFSWVTCFQCALGRQSCGSANRMNEEAWFTLYNNNKATAAFLLGKVRKWCQLFSQLSEIGRRSLSPSCVIYFVLLHALCVTPSGIHRLTSPRETEHSARLADSGAGFAPSRLFAPLGVAKIKRPRPPGQHCGCSVCEKKVRGHSLIGIGKLELRKMLTAWSHRKQSSRQHRLETWRQSVFYCCLFQFSPFIPFLVREWVLRRVCDF